MSRRRNKVFPSKFLFSSILALPSPASPFYIIESEQSAHLGSLISIVLGHGRTSPESGPVLSLVLVGDAMRVIQILPSR